MILLITFLYCCGYINTVVLYSSFDEKYRSGRLNDWWPVLAAFFWWIVALFCFYEMVFGSKKGLK